MELSPRDTDELYRAALADATARAREKASSLANASGHSIGATLTIEELWGNSAAGWAEGPMLRGAGGPDLLPGRQTVSAGVRATYELRD
jgi:uncharacterized protein YggE